jgi:hypothetical protein
MRGLFAVFLFLVCDGALAQQNPPPRLIPIGCNFDGGLAWLALGKASAGPELKSFRIEISDVDLESVEATISPSKMDMFALRPRSRCWSDKCRERLDRSSTCRRRIEWKCRHHPLQYLVFLFHPDRVSGAWVNLVHSRAQQQEHGMSPLDVLRWHGLSRPAPCGHAAMLTRAEAAG